MLYKNVLVNPEWPVFVCERCGNLLRLIFSETQDGAQCDFCGTVMTKTGYVLDDCDGGLMYMKTKEARLFRRNIFQKYVVQSGVYDEKLHMEREKLLKESRRGSEL